MRSVLTVLCLIASGLALADTPPADPAASQFKPRTYALVAAVGNSFSVVTEFMSTGTRLEPYKRRNADASGDVLNRLVLQSLDQQVEAMDPDGKRVYLSIPGTRLPRVPPDRREQANFDAAIAELKLHTERSQWDRILVVTPAYRSQDKDGMGTKLQGMGVFVEPMCQSGILTCAINAAPLDGPRATQPDGTEVTANTFIAPYMYITVWELEPQNLTVLDKLQVFDHHKMTTPDFRTGGEVREIDRKLLAAEMIKVIGASLHDALRQTDLVGHVEVRPVKDASPDPAR